MAFFSADKKSKQAFLLEKCCHIKGIFTAPLPKNVNDMNFLYFSLLASAPCSLYIVHVQKITPPPLLHASLSASSSPLYKRICKHNPHTLSPAENTLSAITKADRFNKKRCGFSGYDIIFCVGNFHFPPYSWAKTDILSHVFNTPKKIPPCWLAQKSNAAASINTSQTRIRNSLSRYSHYPPNLPSPSCIFLSPLSRKMRRDFFTAIFWRKKFAVVE